MRVAVVTDTTAYLPPDLQSALRIFTVPVHVVVDGVSYDEGSDYSPADLTADLRAGKRVTTSRPSPGVFMQAYEQIAHEGYDQIVSIHLSSAVSATVSSADIAARSAPIPVHTVDSETLGMGMGYAVSSAAEAAQAGESVDVVTKLALDRARSSSTLFYVDTLEYLRRGGRIGRASQYFGSALAIKPLLQLRDGQVEPLARVRTSAKAIARMEELTHQAISTMDQTAAIDVAVMHLAAQDRAEQLAERLAQSGPSIARTIVVEVGAVVGAHVGPGTLAVVASPRPEHYSGVAQND